MKPQAMTRPPNATHIWAPKGIPCYQVPLYMGTTSSCTRSTLCSHRYQAKSACISVRVGSRLCLAGGSGEMSPHSTWGRFQGLVHIYSRVLLFVLIGQLGSFPLVCPESPSQNKKKAIVAWTCSCCLSATRNASSYQITTWLKELCVLHSLTRSKPWVKVLLLLLLLRGEPLARLSFPPWLRLLS